MTKAVLNLLTDRATSDGFSQPRTDLLVEYEIAPGHFGQTTGPFDHYERHIQTTDAGNGQIQLAEVTEFRMATPFWRPVLHPLMKRAVLDTDRTPRKRWWWPAEVVDTHTTTLIALLSILAIVGGYLGTVLSQTITFASFEFGEPLSAQADTLAGIRLGVLVALVLLRRADQLGRRPLIIGFLVGSLLFTLLGAVTGSLLTLGFTQAIARGLVTGLVTLVTLAAAEEVPASMRTFILAILTACAALGSGMVVWALPLADTGIGGWRIIYVVPAIFLPVVWWLAKHLPETRRFKVANTVKSSDAISQRRLWMLLATFFALLVFASPASQLQNDYLRDTLGMDATDIASYRLVVSLPGGMAILVAGYMADRKYRNTIAAVGVLAGSIAAALVYKNSGLPMWIFGSLGVLFLGAAVPTMRGYQAELFPTRARARVGAWLDVVAVAGSATGLLIVGRLADRVGGLGNAMSWLLIGPVVSALLLFFVFPDTASKELEEFNPGDPTPTQSATPK